MFIDRIKRKTLGKTAVLLLAMVVGVSVLLAGCGQTTTAKKSLSPADQLAAKRGYVLVGMVAPMTGPLASFGQSLNWIMKKALGDINKGGGIYIKSLGKKLPLKVDLMDSQSSPTIAAQVATELITKDKVNLVLPIWAPPTVDPVSAICERYHTPCLAMGAPENSWLPGGPYHWTYACLSNLQNICQVNMGLWNSEGNKTNKVVGLVFPNNSDGVSWAKVYDKQLPAHGFKIVDPGRFPTTNNDFTSMITLFKSKHVEIIKGSLPASTFTVFWRQAREEGFYPKMCDVSEADLFPDNVASFGDDLGLGMTTETFFGPYFNTKSSITGETAAQLCDEWTKDTGEEWNQTLGQDYSAFELMANVFKRADSLSPKDIVASLAKTDLMTMGWVSPVTFNSQHVSSGPVVSGQWVHGKKWPWVLQVVYTNGVKGITPKPILFPLPH